MLSLPWIGDLLCEILNCINYKMNRKTGNLRFTVAEKTRLAFPAILSGLVLNIVLMINSYFPFIPGIEQGLSLMVGCLGFFLVGDEVLTQLTRVIRSRPPR